MQHKQIGVFGAYGALWKYYADFSSRTSREAFWKAFFLHSLIILVLSLPQYYVYESIIERNDLMASLWFLPLGIYSIATIAPTIAIILRRLHDTDRHGCWFFLFLIPYVGTVIFFIMLSRKTAPFDVYPGRSGSGPYAQPQNPYAPPYNPYAQPQNPYAPPQNPYAPPPVYYRPLPPRRFAPQAGGNKALMAIILSIAVAVASNAYSVVSTDYLQKNLDRYLGSLLNSTFVDDFGGFFDPYGDGGDPWNDTNPWDNDDPWNLFPDFDWDGEGEVSEAALEAIDLVREGVLEGFPDFTIEEVLDSRVEAGTLDWGCMSDDGGEYPVFYVYAVGVAIGDFLMIYAGFDLYDDGRIEIFNIDDGVRDKYYEEALEIYSEWYESMLSSIHNTAS